MQLMRLAPWRYATYSGGGPGHLLTSSDGTRSHASGTCEYGRWRLAAMRNRFCRPSENSSRVSLFEGKAVTAKVQVATANQHV